MAKYIINYWFEWLSETPFWPANDEAYNLGTPIDINKMPLSNKLKEDLINLCHLHDCSLDWDCPSNDSPWTPIEKASFDNKAKSLYQRAIEELPNEYEIVFEHKEFNDKCDIYRLISSDDREYYTHMLEFLNALNLPDEYLCLITDLEHYITKDFHKIFDEPYQLLTVGELIEYLKQEDFQWVWGCLSIFPNNVKKEDILKYELPDGYENTDIFLEYPIIQHPLAIIEFDSFDSSELVFSTCIKEYFDRMKILLPLSK